MTVDALFSSVYTSSHPPMITSHARSFYAILLRAQLPRHSNLLVKPSKRLLATAIPSIGKMKRKAGDSLTAPKAKRAKEPIPDYCDVAPRVDEHGASVWPASAEAIESARSFLREWYVL